MRKYLIKVNGSAYEVEVEELSAGQSIAGSAAAALAPSAPAIPVSAPVQVAAPVQAAPVSAPPAASAATGTMGSEVVKAPMPGTILNIAVALGASVKKGQVLCVLEAMKMENEIVSPRDGIVAGVHTSKGNSVQAGEVLVSLN